MLCSFQDALLSQHFSLLSQCTSIVTAWVIKPQLLAGLLEIINSDLTTASVQLCRMHHVIMFFFVPILSWCNIRRSVVCCNLFFHFFRRIIVNTSKAGRQSIQVDRVIKYRPVSDHKMNVSTQRNDIEASLFLKVTFC